MSVLGCFRTKIATGKVDIEAGRKLLGWIDALKDEYRDKVAAAEADRMAAQGAVARVDFEARRAEELAMRALEARIEALDRIATYRAATDALGAEKGDFGVGDKRPITMAWGVVPMPLGTDRTPVVGRALRSLFARDQHEIMDGPNVHYRARDIRGRAHAIFAEGIEAMRPKMLGLKTDAALDEAVGRAILDGKADDALARDIAGRWKKTDAYLVDEFNKAGGDVLPRDNYLPQIHDRAKVKAASKEAWVAFTKDHLDRAAMIDRATDAPMSDARLTEVLNTVYDTISRGGLDDRVPDATPRGGPPLAEQRGFERILHFRGYDGWNAYREQFGDGRSVYETILSHIQNISSDTAQMALLGPDPRAFRRFVENTYAQYRAALSGEAAPADAKAFAASVKSVKTAEAALARDERLTLALFDEVTGAAHAPVDVGLAHAMATMRGYLSGVQLGSAVISSLADQGSLAMTARINGVPAMAVLRRALADMKDGTSEIRAAQAGLIADTLAHTARVAHDDTMVALGQARVMQMSTALIRASGLRRWTAVLRNAFAMEWMAQLANKSGQAFDQLDERTLKAFARYGITETQWDAMRRSQPFEPEPGATLLRPVDVADRDASERFLRMLNQEMDHAVIETDANTRALLTQGTRPGTLEGEMLRAGALYKGFPVTFFAMHFGRAFARGWDGDRLGHGALTLLAVWGMGALAMQAKEISQGRDPLSLDPSEAAGRKAWIKALFQSGGLGIFGDLVAQDKTRMGNSWAATLAGPQVGLAESVFGQWLIKNTQLAAAGKETHFAGDALYIGARYLPGSSLWYARLALQRAVFDQAALMIDERAPERFRRIEREAREKFAQDFWAPPGEAPFRAPDLSRMFGGQP